MKLKYFKSKTGNIALPVFFPDATRAVIKTLDFVDVENTKTPGILVNTYHLYKDLGKKVVEKHHGIRNFMSWQGGLISDSGGFQVMSLAKKLGGKNAITDKGVVFEESGRKIELTPEKSVAFQMALKTDMVVVLDDFTPLNATYAEAKTTVVRTILWAKRSKTEFEKICKTKKLSKTIRPYILGVVQGGKYQDLRKYCIEKLLKIGFDGLGYGGWPINEDESFDHETAKTISENTPKNYLLFGLGIGKPQDIVACAKLGFTIFDCVLPTRDARHKRLYVYNAKTIDQIDVNKPNFYSYFFPSKQKYFLDSNKVSTACDCLLCTRYTRSYLYHLFKSKEITAMRLATIHNLRFYSILMEKIAKQNK